ncbi:hypothetical protein DSL72_000013 [Monilinia vaccinii-corymbosi]|uniref:Rhodopsin domain-containing protein n=1 Tax=Monilinia vaccinii-corymbosi TaxID=61207 RepID=A0A8A3P984_9HELO|nr:hypothetical protein DSL72_000013 [Monilinia vaccinii-corymbosi]
MEAPPTVDLSANRGPTVERLTIAMMVLITLAIILRFWSRTVATNSAGGRNKHFWWDDWLALVAVPFALAELSLALVWVHDDGLGRHVEAITTPQLLAGLKLLFAGQILQNCSLAAARLSVLFFYLRVSAGSDHLRMIHAITVVMPCSKELVAISPRPLSETLHLVVLVCNSQCSGGFGDPIDPNAYIMEIATQVVETIWHLVHLCKRLLVSLTTVESISQLASVNLSISVLATAIGRVVSLHLSGNGLQLDPTYESIPTLYWFIIEPALAIFSICLPSIFSLFKRGVNFGPKSLFSLKSNAESWIARRSSRSIPRFGGKKNASSVNSQFERLSDAVPEGNNQEYIAMVGRGSQNGSSSLNEDVNQFIQVRTKYDVSKSEIPTHISRA